jgi:hypothetical protein
MAIQIKSAGRPTSYTPDIEEHLIQLIGNGNYIGTACQAVGIHRSTFENWCDNAKRVDDYLDNNSIYIEDIDAFDVSQLPDDIQKLYIYFRMFYRLKRAEAEAEAKHVGNLMAAGSAGPQFWAASATYLERKHPDRWAKRDAIDISVKDSQVLLEKLAKALKSGE